jgi:hypothetical protein
MGANSEMETLFAGNLYEIPLFGQHYLRLLKDLYVLVGADTGCFERLGAQLFVLVGHHMDAEREFVDICTLATEVEDSDLRVWDTAVEATLGVRLFISVAGLSASLRGLTHFVLAVSVASCGSSGHFGGFLCK